MKEKSIQKPDKKTDRRQLRTRRRIREAFVALVMEKELGKITIKELAERADIDRKTFYLHYSAIGDVLEELQNELLEKVDQLVSAYDVFQPDFDALRFFRDINQMIDQEYAFYRRMLQASEYRFFYDKLKEAMKDFLWEKYYPRVKHAKLSLVKLKLYSEYATSGVMSLYVEWLKHPEYDLEAVAEAASEIAYGGAKAVLDRIRTAAEKNQEEPL